MSTLGEFAVWGRHVKESRKNSSDHYFFIDRLNLEIIFQEKNICYPLPGIIELAPSECAARHMPVDGLLKFSTSFKYLFHQYT